MTTDSCIYNSITSFTDSLHSVLGEKLLSVYLYGSVTLHDYKDGWSDIDLICFSREPLLPNETEKLLVLRQTLVESEKSPMFRKIEGAVVCVDEFLKNRYSRVVYWGTSGQRITDKYTFDFFSMFGLMKYGELVYGEDIRNRFACPNFAELADGVKLHYESIRKYAQTTDESIYSCGWLLDIARCLYTLKNGEIISKTDAGKWALDEEICPCADDLERTLKIRNDPKEYIGLPETKQWLCSLGPSVQSFADVLEKELMKKIELFESP